MQDNITIVVMSCDKYATAWYPFFELLKKYWPDHPEKIVLCTDTMHYTHDGLSLTCIANGTTGQWSDRLLDVLQQINTKYVLFSLEDYFLQAPVRKGVLQNCVQYMESHPEVAQFRFKNCDNEEQIAALGEEILPDFYEAGPDVIYRFDTQIAVWNREVLMKFIAPGENPWQFETRGTERAKNSTYQFLWYKSKSDPANAKLLLFPYHMQPKYGYGITAGHWLWNNEKLFRQNGIQVDFSAFGVYTELQYKYQAFVGKALYQNPPGLHYKVFSVGYRAMKKIVRITRRVF